VSAWRKIRGWCITGVCLSPAVAINAIYQLSNESMGSMRYVFAGASVLSVIGACVSVKVMKKSLRDRDYAAFAIALMVFTPTFTFDLMNAVGAAGLARSETTGVRRGLNTGVSTLQQELADKKKQKETPASVADGQTPAMVESDMKALQQDRRWTSSESCEKATAGPSREFCTTYRGKEKTLAAARSVEKLDGEIAIIQGKLDKLSGNAAVGEAIDPQSNSIANGLGLFGLSVPEGNIASFASLLLAIVVEIIGAFLPAVFDKNMEEDRQRKLAPAKPETGIPATGVTGVQQGSTPKPPRRTVNRAKDLTEPPQDIAREYCAARVFERVGRVQAKDLLSDHEAWCKPKGYKPLNQTSLGNAMKALGFQKEVIGGRTYYKNIALKGAALKVVARA
jgi:hypothetical protein